MLAFRGFLLVVFVSIVSYTAVVVSNHGLNLLPVFFGDIAKMEWPGQFNLDFLGLLLLSGFWIAWRNGFSASGILLGALAAFLGAPFLTAYLFVASISSGGDVRLLLLGPERA